MPDNHPQGSLEHHLAEHKELGVTLAPIILVFNTLQLKKEFQINVRAAEIIKLT